MKTPMRARRRGGAARRAPRRRNRPGISPSCGEAVVAAVVGGEGRGQAHVVDVRRPRRSRCRAPRSRNGRRRGRCAARASAASVRRRARDRGSSSACRPGQSQRTARSGGVRAGRATQQHVARTACLRSSDTARTAKPSAPARLRHACQRGGSASGATPIAAQYGDHGSTQRIIVIAESQAGAASPTRSSRRPPAVSAERTRASTSSCSGVRVVQHVQHDHDVGLAESGGSNVTQVHAARRAATPRARRATSRGSRSRPRLARQASDARAAASSAREQGPGRNRGRAGARPRGSGRPRPALRNTGSPRSLPRAKCHANRPPCGRARWPPPPAPRSRASSIKRAQRAR